MVGAPEIFVENPLSTNNPGSFWNTTLDEYIANGPAIARNLVDAVKELYGYWAQKYCKRGSIRNTGLKDEPYFRYFKYVDFLTPTSGLIQIRKFAEVTNKVDLLQQFENVSGHTKKVREDIHRLLIEDFGYFQIAQIVSERNGGVAKWPRHPSQKRSISS